MKFPEFKQQLIKKCRKCKGKCTNISCMIAIKKQLVEQDDYVTNGLKRMRLPVDIIEREGVIGLRNLGATCYLNALLENWFYIESFRNGILSFSGTDLIIYELQKTFMFLKESKRSSYDPKTFIDSMGLGYSVQQDVQEFTKLLLLRLDSTFQQVTSLQDLVSSHFKGNLTYLTTCLNCKRVSSRQEEFLELEVSLSESLNESIHRLLYKELLTDSNKYACGNCGNLQDATREVQLESLPPILNIQFLRFVYDLKSFTKKKLKTKVKFTKTLDFNGIAQGDSEDLIYDLHAVLLHRGQSANSGHYVIRVYNEENDSWYDLDDDTVTRMENVMFELYSGLTSGESTKKKAFKKSSALEKDEYESCSAYVLTYIRRSFKSSYPKYEINSDLQQALIDDNKAFDQEWLEFENVKQGLEMEYDRKMLSFTPLFEPPLDFSSGVFVDSKLLQNFVSSEFRVASKLKDFKDEETGGEDAQSQRVQLFNPVALCEHNKLGIGAIDNLKLISLQALKNLQEMGCIISHVFSMNDICEACFNDEMSQQQNLRDHAEHILIFNSKAMNGQSDEFIISKLWLNEWKRKTPRFSFENGTKYPAPFDDPYRSDVFCTHDGIKIEDGKVALISKERMEFLQSLFPGTEKVSVNHPTCLECSMELDSQKQVMNERKQQKDTFKHLYANNHVDIIPGNTYYLISSSKLFLLKAEFRSEWRTYIQGKSNNVPEIDNSILLCKEHNRIMFDLKLDQETEMFRIIPEEEWRDLKLLYEGGPEISVTSVIGDNSLLSSIELCGACRKKRMADYEEAMIVIQNLTEQKESYVVDSSSSEKSESDASDFDIEKGDIPMKAVWLSKQKDKKKSLPKKRFRIEDYAVDRRQSKRLRNTDVFEVKIHKGMTLRKLKLKIMSHINASPSFQKLSLRGKELEDDDKTLNDYSVFPNDILTLEILKQEQLSANKSDPEAGFAGTSLLPDSGFSGSNEMVLEASSLSSEITWECAQCTFINANRETCEMCDAGQITIYKVVINFEALDTHFPMHKYPATPPLTSPVSQDQTFSQLRAIFKGCHACGTFSTPLCKVKILYIGRRGPFGLKTLCNSCGLKYAQGRALLVKPHTALAAAGFEGEMIDKSVKVHQRMYIKNADEPNVILRKQFSPKGNILGQTLILNKSARQLFPETKPPSKKRLTKEKRLELLLKESDEEVDDHEIMSDFLKSVHKRREMLGKLPSISDNGSSRSNHEK